MKRYIILLLFCLLSCSFVHAADKFRCDPATISVEHTGGVYFVKIFYDEILPPFTLPIAPNIETMNTPQYDSRYVESVKFVNKSQFNVNFKMRDKSERIDGTITFGFYIKDRETGFTNYRTCTLSYTYPAVTSLIPGIISAPDETYAYGTSPSRIASVMPAMSGYSKSITYQWQKKSGAGVWENIPGSTSVDCFPDKVGYTSTYYRRVANDSYSTAYTNEVEIRTALSAGIIGMKYTDTSSVLMLTDKRTPSVSASQCSWESSTDLNFWTPISGTGYTKQLTKPALTTYYRRVAATVDGKYKSYSNTVCCNLDTPVYITTKTARDQQGASSIEDRIYYDGLGRPGQTVNVGATPTGEDLVSVAVYDEKGRQADSYLPFAAAGGGAYVHNALDKQDEYYTAKFNGSETLYPFTHTEYDSSPLDRVVKTVRPGSEYRQGLGRSIQQTHTLNIANEVLRIKMNSADVTGITVTATYAPKTLYKTTVTNEDNAMSEIFTDTNGRTILSRQRISIREKADTYYVYDDADRLRWVISPEGSARLVVGTSWALTDDNANKYCYRYTYDADGNVQNRYIPGRAPEYTTYDAAGRIKTSQSGAMREQNAERSYYYDPIGRLTRTALKIKIIMIDPENPWGGEEALDRFGAVDFPTKPIGQSHDTEYHTYDAYDLSSVFSGHEFAEVPGIVALADRAADVRGLKTHERIFEALDAAAFGPQEQLPSSKRTFYYDKRNRLLQSVETMPLGHTMRISYKYDYTGNTLVRYEQYLADSQPTTVAYIYSYAPRGRVTAETVEVNGIKQTAITNTYDQLGQLKKVKAENGINTNYDYNLQGWLTSNITRDRLMITPLEWEITRPPIGGGETVAPQPEVDWQYEQPGIIFGQKIKYFDAMSATRLYSGNISEVSWSRGKAPYLMYCYTYDDLGRLTDSQLASSGASINPSCDERYIAYDKNGNIGRLTRTADESTINDLNYTYSGNKLSTITDRGSSYSYSYDVMGNMTHDGPNNIDISYNFLNLVKNVRQSNTDLANYSYLSDGTKLAATDAAGNGLVYLGSLVYKKQGASLAVESVPFSRGRIVKTTTGFEPHYFITDHLGSVRTIANADLEIIEKSDYYPFGMRWNNAQLSDNRYGYNGKEEQAFLNVPYSDYGARQYDSKYRLSWNGIDILAEDTPGVSPIVFCNNNPILFMDPDGRKIQVYDFVDDQRVDYEWREHEGTWGFYDSNNALYTGNNLFIGQLSGALTGLMTGGKIGYDLVRGLANHSNTVTLMYSDKSGADHQDQLGWNSTGVRRNGDVENIPTTAGLQNNPMITLGHELGHVEFNWGDEASATWFNMTTTDNTGNPTHKAISTSEIYTTHVENQLRSENRLPLRTHYGVQNNYGYGPRIINTSTRASRYYNSNGITNYTPLKKGNPPFIY